jgi:hypothetical protein
MQKEEEFIGLWPIVNRGAYLAHRLLLVSEGAALGQVSTLLTRPAAVRIRGKKINSL